jgi:actin-related protein 3
VDPSEHRVILTEPPSNTPENREQIAEIMFETFGVKGLFIGVQAALALYAQIAKSGDTDGKTNLGSDMTGTVIDAGDGVTHVFPVCDSYVIASCVKSLPLAGRDITKFILQQLKDRGEQIPDGDGMEIAQTIKERFGYCCVDMQKEFQKFDKKEEREDGTFAQSSKFRRLVHKTLNNNLVEMDVGYERFLGPEMFFHPVSRISGYHLLGILQQRFHGADRANG